MAAIVLIALAAAVLFGPFVSPGDPLRPRLQDRLQPPSWTKGTVSGALAGTDSVGRDVLSRIIYGARVSVVVGLCSVLLAGVVGVVTGVVAGYARGWLDEAIMFATDVQMSCPFLLLAIALAAVLGPGVENAVIALAVAGWPTYCRIVRAEVLSLRTRDFVQSSVALGSSSVRIMRKDLLPSLVAPMTVVATLMVSRMIVTEASLSFLGLGVQPQPRPGAS